MVRRIILLFAIVLSLGFGVQARAQEAPDYSAFCDALAEQQVALNDTVAQTEAELADARSELDAYEAMYVPLYNSLATAFAAYPDIAAAYITARDTLIANINQTRAQLDAVEADFNTQVAAAQAAIDAMVVAYNC